MDDLPEWVCALWLCLGIAIMFGVGYWAIEVLQPWLMQHGYIFLSGCVPVALGFLFPGGRRRRWRK